VDKLGDLVFATVLSGGVELAELLEYLVVFEVNADDVVVVAAAFDRRPVNDAIDGGPKRIAHVSLLEDSLITSAGAAIGQKLLGGDFGAADAINGIHEAELNGVGERDAEVDVPGAGRIFEF